MNQPKIENKMDIIYPSPEGHNLFFIIPDNPENWHEPVSIVPCQYANEPEETDLVVDINVSYNIKNVPRIFIVSSIEEGNKLIRTERSKFKKASNKWYQNKT